MGMSYRGGDVALHAIECSFGSRLVLMNRDKIGAVFGDSAALFFFAIIRQHGRHNLPV